MRCHPTRWLWGLIPIAMLSWIAVHVEADRIERDLESRGRRALGAASYEWASVIFSGRDGMLAGTPGSRRERAEALALVRSLWGVRTVVARKGLLEQLNPVRLAGLRAPETRLGEAMGSGSDVLLREVAPASLAAGDPDALADLHPDYVTAYEQEASSLTSGLLDAQKTQIAPVATIDTAAIPDIPEASAISPPDCRAALLRISAASKIHFARGEVQLDAHGRAILDRLAEVAAGCPSLTLKVGGYADADGPEWRNLSLSERRAHIVVSYLIRKGIDAGRLQAVGYGETRPVAPNDTTQNRARNRRIEVEVAEPLHERNFPSAGQGAGNGLLDR